MPKTTASPLTLGDEGIPSPTDQAWTLNFCTQNCFSGGGVQIEEYRFAKQMTEQW